MKQRVKKRLLNLCNILLACRVFFSLVQDVVGNLLGRVNVDFLFNFKTKYCCIIENIKAIL